MAEIKIILVDLNPKMVEAWEDSFDENPEVVILNGSMLEQTVDAWVSPTNSQGSMDGGLDAVIKKHFGQEIENRLKKQIHKNHAGFLPVGEATCITTGQDNPKFLISTPTMSSSSEDISDTMNVALACAAAFQSVHMQNQREHGSITSVALPGLGTNTGKVPVEICADLMWTGYNLFLEHQFVDFSAMRIALEEQLGSLGPSSPIPKPGKLSPKASPHAPPAKQQDIDFDDFS